MELRLPDDLVLKDLGLADQYFDLKGLSAYSSMCVGTLREHIKYHALPSYLVNGKTLVRRSDFDKWMERYRVNQNVDLDRLVDGVIGDFNRRSER